MLTIGIIGLGYVGLPLSLQFSTKGARVIGFDVDPVKVDHLNAGRSYIRHIPAELIKSQVAEGSLTASTDFSRVSEVNAIIICVPTPLGPNREPDLSFVLGTARSIAPYLKPSQTVILESTTYPGTTEDELRPCLESGSGLTAGKHFFLAYSPEREDPGNTESQASRIPKVIGGLTPDCLEHAKRIYRIAIETLVPVSSCRVAEATKLLENIFRSVNIALINELKIVYGAMGIDIWDVIAAAKTKPFGYMPFYPGPGLGGHCIPIDPFYLAWKAREYGLSTRFIELAGEINTTMPTWVVQKVTEALNRARKCVNGSRILILGLSYKPNIDDDRESPSYVLMNLLHDLGAHVAYHDPYIPVVRPNREHPHWAGTRSTPWNEKSIRSYDLVLIATAHTAINYRELALWAQSIIDTRNAMSDTQVRPTQVLKA